MRGYPDDIVAALSETEVRTLRRVFEAVCIEFKIPRRGKRIQGVANFLMAEFRRHPRDEDMFLAAARAFCCRQEPGHGYGVDS